MLRCAGSVATQKIVEKEFALSGSEQNPDLTGKDVKLLLNRVKAGVSGPVQAFLDRGEDFVVATTLRELVEGMNRITGGTPELDLATVEREVVARDREMDNPFTKDLQVTAIHGARRYLAGSWVFDYQTVEQRAERLLELERWDLGLDEPLLWPERISRVTPKQVRDAARAHIRPDSLSRVEYGPLRPRARAECA